jgi:hypothetical protein
MPNECQSRQLKRRFYFHLQGRAGNKTITTHKAELTRLPYVRLSPPIYLRFVTPDTVHTDMRKNIGTHTVTLGPHDKGRFRRTLAGLVLGKRTLSSLHSAACRFEPGTITAQCVQLLFRNPDLRISNEHKT